MNFSDAALQLLREIRELDGFVVARKVRRLAVERAFRSQRNTVQVRDITRAHQELEGAV